VETTVVEESHLSLFPKLRALLPDELAPALAPPSWSLLLSKKQRLLFHYLQPAILMLATIRY
jgi:hypothetical protein